MVISDEDKVLIDLIGRSLKYKKKQVNESGEKKSERKKRNRYEMPKEKNMRKAIKKSLKGEEKRKKRAIDEAVEVSTSSAPAKGLMPELISIVRHPIKQETTLTTPTTIWVTDVEPEAKKASPKSTNS